MPEPELQAREQVEAAVLELKPKNLESLELVAVYAPEAENGKAAERNLTFRLTFRHAERTLKDLEVDKEREKVAQSLVSALGVKI